MTPYPTATTPGADHGDRDWLDRVGTLHDPSGATLTLRRSWPRSADHVLLEYGREASPEGLVVGQWFADTRRARHVATAMATELGAGAASLLPAHGIVLHRHGADRRLAALPQLLADPAARLVVHRPERRAVVRLDPRPDVRDERRWVKIVRPDRLDVLLARADALSASPLVVPQLLEVQPARGVSVWSDVRGTPLSELLDDRTLHDTMARIGVAVGRLHGQAVALPDVHTAGDELLVLRRWLTHMERFAPEMHPRAARLLGPVTALLHPDRDARDRLVTVHRDLHDGQILVDGWRIGLLDPDTLARGEPELDLGNLAAHLRLAACAGRCPEPLARAAIGTLLDAYGRDRLRMDRLGAYTAASLLRLMAVHAFRPATRTSALNLDQHVAEALRGDG